MHQIVFTCIAILLLMLRAPVAVVVAHVAILLAIVLHVVVVALHVVAGVVVGLVIHSLVGSPPEKKQTNNITVSFFAKFSNNFKVYS